MLNQDRVQQLKDIVAGQRDLMFAAERHIWKHPETGYREWKTHAYLKEQYEKLGQLADAYRKEQLQDDGDGVENKVPAESEPKENEG